MQYPRPMLTPDRRRARTVVSTGGGGDQCPEVVTGGNVDSSGSGLRDTRPEQLVADLAIGRAPSRTLPLGNWIATVVGGFPSNGGSATHDSELSLLPSGLQEWQRTRYIQDGTRFHGSGQYASLNWIVLHTSYAGPQVHIVRKTWARMEHAATVAAVADGHFNRPRYRTNH